MKFKTGEIFTFLTGIFIISFIIWNRFIRVRLPKEILADGSLAEILGVTCLFLLFLILFLYSFNKILPRKKNKESWVNKIILYISNNYYLNRILSFIINRVIQAPIFVYNEVYKRVYMRPVIEYIGPRISAKLNNYTKVFYFILFVIPKMIVSICFFIDVIIHKEILYFYNSLVLLIIPLVLNVVLFVIQHHAVKQRERIEYFFVFEETETKIYISFQPYLTTDEREFGLTVDCDAWYLFNKTCIEIENFVNQINEIKNLYKYEINIFYYGIYLIGFFGYLLILFNFY
jgi:hypothetical protein